MLAFGVDTLVVLSSLWIIIFIIVYYLSDIFIKVVLKQGMASLQLPLKYPQLPVFLFGQN